MSRRITISLVAGIVAAGTALVALASPASAATVSNEAQLKAAFATESVIDISQDIVLGDCTGGGAVVRLVGNSDPVTINGNGHTVQQTCTDNVFIQNGTGLMTVNDLRITGGHASGHGGGIFAQGPLTVVDSSVFANRSDAGGGGLASEGLITVLRSTIDSNVCGGCSPGGVSIGPDSPGAVFTDSTVSNNAGGGIGTVATEGDVSVTVVNSTVTGNTLAGQGGGIFSGGSTVLVYADVVNNTANQAFANIDTHTLESFGSVVAGGPPDANCLVGTTTSHGYNFSDDDSCDFTAPTDRQNAGDPVLGPLADNGGPTQTLLPQAGSPLLDWIPVEACQADGAAGITADQRGVTRPQGDGCDVGSVEVEVPLPPPPPPPPPPPVEVTPRFTG